MTIRSIDKMLRADVDHEFLDSKLGGNRRVSNLDGATDNHGHVLFSEAKSGNPRELPPAQLWLHEALLLPTAPPATVIFWHSPAPAGEAMWNEGGQAICNLLGENRVVTGYQLLRVVDGEMRRGDIEEANTQELRSLYGRWDDKTTRALWEATRTRRRAAM